MGYTATCNRCDTSVEQPLLLGQFNPQAMRSTRAGGLLADHDYTEGDTLTFCPDCTVNILLNQ